jgi:predicted RNase H-like nuclease (RuvC/YqgF family)
MGIHPGAEMAQERNRMPHDVCVESIRQISSRRGQLRHHAYEHHLKQEQEEQIIMLQIQVEELERRNDALAAAEHRKVEELERRISALNQTIFERDDTISRLNSEKKEQLAKESLSVQQLKDFRPCKDDSADVLEDFFYAMNDCLA